MARTLAAMREGRARWVERMRKAIAMGEIERFPGGAPKRNRNAAKKAKAKASAPAAAPPEAKAPGAEAAQPVAIADDMTRRAALIAWHDKTPAQKLAFLGGMSLDVCHAILSLPLAGKDNPKLLSVQRDVALSLLNLQYKVGEAAAEREERERQRQAILDELARRLEEKR